MTTFPQNVNRLLPIVALAALEVTTAMPAMAQGLDVQQGTTTLVTALLLVFGVLILGVAGWKGIEAVMDHRSVMPSLIGLVLGIALCFGGAWILTKMGVGGTATLTL
jgi:uncharacterized membrane protein YidH (DUF202 family)